MLKKSVSKFELADKENPHILNTNSNSLQLKNECNLDLSNVF